MLSITMAYLSSTVLSVRISLYTFPGSKGWITWCLVRVFGSTPNSKLMVQNGFQYLFTISWGEFDQSEGMIWSMIDETDTFRGGDSFLSLEDYLRDAVICFGINCVLRLVCWGLEAGSGLAVENRMPAQVMAGPESGDTQQVTVSHQTSPCLRGLDAKSVSTDKVITPLSQL